MKLKQCFLLLFILLFLNGCSSLTPSEQENTAIKTITDRDYISDTEVEHSVSRNTEIAAENDSVIESTHRVLQSSTTTVNARDQINGKPINIHEMPEFDNVWERLPDMFKFSDTDNKRIQIQQEKFLKHKRQLKAISQRASPFLYLITEEVDKRNMPGEIALLPIIESEFKTKAYSGKKAAGLWQFVPATGRHFGLQQTWWYDGRKDVYKSTHAALTYLEQLNKYYKGDWMLTLAAYNAGSGTINKAVRKNRQKGRPIDYWSLDLTKETRNYVPKLMAMAKLIQHAKDYSINLTPIENSPQLKLLDIQSQIDLSVAAKMAGISLAEIQTYNPAFNQWATDPDGPHHLLMPIDKVNHFEKQLAMLDEDERVQRHRHKIRSGESLSVIARTYNISIKALKKANRLKSNGIRAGKYLMLPGSSIPDINSTTIAFANIEPASSPAGVIDKSKAYTVRKGDSFWKISRRFKIPHRKLAALNGLSANDTLSIGQVLLVGYNSSSNTKFRSDKTVTVKTPASKDLISKTREISYKVQQGDSLYVISKRFKVSISELKNWNALNNKKYLQPGQELKVHVTILSQAI
ncbi:MAG: LysM peptidoglycan-binding domain-containing protein [Gammaproteobacteria bacterium]|nr:LysM peptidoglycan-binding domain-containing protein [Gammaproteobacteria bacterium]